MAQELHAHLNGSISRATLLKLLDMKKTAMTVGAGLERTRARMCGYLLVEHHSSFFLQTDELRRATTTAQTDCRTLEECFALFGVIHKLIDSEAALRMVRGCCVWTNGCTVLMRGLLGNRSPTTCWQSLRATACITSSCAPRPSRCQMARTSERWGVGTACPAGFAYKMVSLFHETVP